MNVIDGGADAEDRPVEADTAARQAPRHISGHAWQCVTGHRRPALPRRSPKPIRSHRRVRLRGRDAFCSVRHHPPTR
jgi:hypothetical protein